jgi:hypothetical protein
MDELFCLNCGVKEEISDKTRSGWMIQFNGLICPVCDKTTTCDGRKQFT